MVQAGGAFGVFCGKLTADFFCEKGVLLPILSGFCRFFGFFGMKLNICLMYNLKHKIHNMYFVF